MKNLKVIFTYLFVFLSFIIPLKINALSHNWIEVPKSRYGQQLWDQDSIHINQDGSLRVLSKFIPITKNEITQDILYTMDINCSEKTYRDIAVGAKEFNEFKNINAKWKYPNGDKLLLGVITQVCDFKN